MTDILTIILIIGIGVFLFYIYTKIEALQGEIQTVSKPAETLGGVVSSLHQSITDISTSAEKIKILGEKYSETEKLTKTIHSILIGSYSKGKTGENMLRHLMNELMNLGYIKTNERFGSKVVEYCVDFKDGKVLAIDSKVVSTEDIERFYDEDTSEEERGKLRRKIKHDIKRKIDEVAQYIEIPKTLPCAVMAVPDAAIEMASDIIPRAIDKNVIVVGYSAVPQLITYFVKIHGFYAIEESVEELQEKIIMISQEIGKLDDNFFANRLERPLQTIQNATTEIKTTIGKINNRTASTQSILDENFEKK